MYRGEGYEYYSNLSSLQGFVKRLKGLDVPNEEVIKQLGMLKTRVNSSTMTSARKTKIIRYIDELISSFGVYRSKLDAIIRLLKITKL